MYAGEERRYQKRCQQYTYTRAKSERPPQRVDEQPQIAGVADDGIKTAGDQCVSGLDRDQPAEAPAEHKNRPDPQSTTGGEQHDAKPANSLAVEDPEPLPTL